MRLPPLVILALIATVSLLTTAALAATTIVPAPTATASDDALVRELAERLLAPAYGGPYGPQVTAKLYPGRLPDGVDLPLPAKARLVGSVARTMRAPNSMGPKGIGPSTEVVLDVPGEAPEAFESIKAALTAGGWTAPQLGQMQPRGFQPSLAVTNAMFCKSSSWLNVMVGGREGPSRDVRLQQSSAESGMAGPCGAPQQPQVSKPFPPGYDKLPGLYAPKGVALQVLGAPSGPNRWASEAVADTSTSARNLEAHFAKQLAAAGWSRVVSGADRPLAWSTWKVDATWTGLLLVFESSGGKRDLSVRVMSDAAPGAR